MASSAFPTHTRLSGIISCAICFESKQGRNPKGLHCFHSFCRSCLQGYQAVLHNKDEIDCPMCRRVTKLPKNGIDGLADDFKVAELIDLMNSIGDPFVCQGCVSRGTQSRARVKCITCDRRLCEDCYEFHITSDLFDNHEISFELCELHGNKVTHVCVTCFLGLCVDCIFSRIHEKHDTCKFSEGIERMKKSMEQDQGKYVDICKNRIAQIAREKERKEDNAKRQINILKVLWASMKDETDAQISAIERKYSSNQRAEIESWFNAEKKKYPPIDLVKDEGDISKLSFTRTELRQSMQQLSDANKRTPDTSMNQSIDRSYFAEIGLTRNLSTELFDRYQNAVQMSEGKPVKIWSTNITTSVVGLEVLEDYSAVVAFKDKDHVVRYDTSGKVNGVYHLANKGDANKVQRITTHDRQLHILSGDNQSLVTITIDTYERHNRRIKNLYDSIGSLAYYPVEGSFFFQQPGIYEDEVFKCVKEKSDATLCSFAGGSLRVVKHQGDYKLIVMRYWDEGVLVYDMHGMLLNTFWRGSGVDGLQRPQDVAMLHHEILLVADSDQHRISMYNLSDGSFVGHLLSRDDGIRNPCYIACKHPYLWIAGDRELQLFKLN